MHRMDLMELSEWVGSEWVLIVFFNRFSLCIQMLLVCRRHVHYANESIRNESYITRAFGELLIDFRNDVSLIILQTLTVCVRVFVVSSKRLHHMCLWQSQTIIHSLLLAATNKAAKIKPQIHYIACVRARSRAFTCFGLIMGRMHMKVQVNATNNVLKIRQSVQSGSINTVEWNDRVSTIKRPNKCSDNMQSSISAGDVGHNISHGRIVRHLCDRGHSGDRVS